jgi:hypothetical protein
MDLAAHIARWWYVYLVGACLLAWVVFNFMGDLKRDDRHRRNLQSIESDAAQEELAS